MSEHPARFTLIETSRAVHLSHGLPVPACGSRAEVLGFRYGLHETVTEKIAQGLCRKCMALLGISLEWPASPAGNAPGQEAIGE